VISVLVDNEGVRLASHDHGGDGPPLVLMHGAGMSQGSLEPVIAHLEGFRVVTFDLRGHGGTDRAAWSFRSSVRDLEAVCAGYDLGVPAVGGHSLGGMVAALYGAEHPTCPGVINIDGHGMGRAEQYVGYDEAEVRAWWDDHRRKVTRLVTGPLGTATQALSGMLRRPMASREAALQVMAEVDQLDLLALYERLTCPLLLFNAVAPQEAKGLMKRVMGDGGPLMRAYRTGLGRDLAALAERKPGMHVVEVDATHMLIRTHPELVAREIAAFLS
jgi:pimeloyl-ACP methyl ester carboxylesterase